MKDLLRYRKALEFAIRGYHNKTRKNSNIPYIIHPLRIVHILRFVGYNEIDNEELFIAALFHDLIEDTDVKYEEIEQEFGKKIADLVLELTIPKDADKEQFFKNMSNASKEAKVIKMADRIDNLLDLDNIPWSNEKKRKYAEHGRIILQSCGDADNKLTSMLTKIVEDILNKY